MYLWMDLRVNIKGNQQRCTILLILDIYAERKKIFMNLAEC